MSLMHVRRPAHMPWFAAHVRALIVHIYALLIVQVRETSRKPDEMYSLLERLSPGTRKLEIFARPHNVQPGWVCLGNQLDGTKIADPEMLAAYTKAYGNPTPPKRQISAAKE